MKSKFLRITFKILSPVFTTPSTQAMLRKSKAPWSPSPHVASQRGYQRAFLSQQTPFQSLAE